LNGTLSRTPIKYLLQKGQSKYLKPAYFNKKLSIKIKPNKINEYLRR